MKRICRPGGMIAAYVWDVTGRGGPAGLLLLALKEHGYDPPPIPGGKVTTRSALHALFEEAGLGDIELKQIEVGRTFASFDEYWRRHTRSFCQA